jgi:pyruvate-formate lyase-activating enzyme
MNRSSPSDTAAFPVEELKGKPNLVVASPDGEIVDIPELAAAFRWGWNELVPEKGEWISMPKGSDLYLMPRRHPIGYDKRTGERIAVREYGGVPVTAVSAFVAPAYTIHYHSLYETDDDAPDLPLYAYCGVGWHQGRFVVPAQRVDKDVRQDCDRYDPEEVYVAALEMMDRYPQNRLAHHLMQNCVLTYQCPAARNFALGRWEMPLPTAASCNSRCLGCISKQPSDSGFHETQYRLDFIPTVEESLELAVPHLEIAPKAVASFGQGCEGEPLSNPDLLEESIRKIRERTRRGTLNLNTNGSRPGAVQKLFRAGLDSIRVSINSPIEKRYNAYFKPLDYTLRDVIESLHTARREAKWSSVNYLVFPGVSDDEKEVRAFLEMAFETRLSMVQWRNLNIDPELYLELLDDDLSGPCLGMKWTIEKVHSHFPKIRRGYYNPPVGTRAWRR